MVDERKLMAWKGVARHALTLVGGALVLVGALESSELRRLVETVDGIFAGAAAIAGAAAAAWGIVLSVREKLRRREPAAP